MPGSGLGLAIVRQVAEMHGGTVVAEEAPGGGTLMRMRLDARVVAEPTATIDPVEGVDLTFAYGPSTACTLVAASMGPAAVSTGIDLPACARI